MRHLRSSFRTSILLFFLYIPTVFAASADLAISESSVHFSNNVFLEGNPVRIYATINNSGTNDLLGTVQFYDKSAGKQIGSDQTVSVFGNKTDDIFIDWVPAFEGNHTIAITIDPWITNGDDPSNNSVSKTVNVLKDTDHDGITDSEDPDDDNDGVEDEIDMFPIDSSEWIDTDGDGKGDNNDEDDDNDGVIDEEDAFPLDSLENDDTDEDGIGNNEDLDDDNDGLDDEEEIKVGTDPIKTDTDEDTVLDGEDAFPLDNSEQYDYDLDGIGDNADDDDDGDGLLDEDDPNDHNKGPKIVIKGGESLIAFIDREFIFNAEDSFDEDGKIKQVQWIIDDKEAKLGKSIPYTFESLGSHTVKVVVLDNSDESRELALNIEVYRLDFYIIIALSSIIILLAILIIIKYSSVARHERSK